MTFCLCLSVAGRESSVADDLQLLTVYLWVFIFYWSLNLLISVFFFCFFSPPQSTGSRSSGSNPSAGKGRRSSPQEKGQRSTCSESEPGIRGGRRGDRSASQMSHHSHAISSQSHARSSLSHSHSHRSHPVTQNNHPPFTYSHAAFTQPAPGSCAQSERSHASSYGPPGLPPPYCLARLAPKTSFNSSTPPGAPPGRELAAVPPELTASRQSFQHAMGNPCEFFVDIMWQNSAFLTQWAQNSSPWSLSTLFSFFLSVFWPSLNFRM